MTDITETIQKPSQVSEGEKKIRGFIQAVLLARPDLAENLSLAACVNYLQLPDSTFGWDAYKEQGKAMPIEYKFACLLPTIVNDLTVGSICWLGNRPYGRVEAFKQMAKREFQPLTGLSFRKLTDDEKEMYSIGPKDMALMCFQHVHYQHNQITIEGLGIIGADESQPNAKGNYKVARELVRDRAQFLRTRAERDMLRRHITISGVPMEDDYEAPEVVEPAKHDPQKIIDVQMSRGRKEPDSKYEVRAILEAFNSAAWTVERLGGNVAVIIQPADSIELRTRLLQDWITENSNPTPPEPPKPKKTRAKKFDGLITRQELGDDTESDLIQTSNVQNIRDAHGIMSDEPLNESEMDAANYIADTAEEPTLTDFEEPIPEDKEELYTGTELQKAKIRGAVIEFGLPQTEAMLLALAAGMKGQPMSKLPEKAKAFGQNAKPRKPKVDEKPATGEQRVRMTGLINKIRKLGENVDQILEGVADDIWEEGSYNDVALATSKLENWYKKYLMSTKKD